MQENTKEIKERLVKQEAKQMMPIQSQCNANF